MEAFKNILGSKKGATTLYGIVGLVVGNYFLKDNPEMAEKVTEAVVYLVLGFCGTQGLADAFGGDAYHKKK